MECRVLADLSRSAAIHFTSFSEPVSVSITDVSAGPRPRQVTVPAATTVRPASWMRAVGKPDCRARDSM
jgi:hypothetical protein